MLNKKLSKPALRKHRAKKHLLMRTTDVSTMHEQQVFLLMVALPEMMLEQLHLELLLTPEFREAASAWSL